MLKLNRKVFFAAVRQGPFPGRLTASQVSGMNDLLDVWEERGTDDPRHLAYALTTDFHETGSKMQPVREGFKNSDSEARAYVQRHYGHKGKHWYCWPQGPHGHVYYGRGDVQLTWYDNYVRMGKILNIPLAEKPDLALDSKVSKMILVEGMLRGASARGDFTGKSLEDYFNDTKDDPMGARRIINGTDRAALLANYHKEFLGAIEAAMQGDLFEDMLPEEAPRRLPPATDETSWGGFLTALGGLGAALGGFTEKLSETGVIACVVVIVIGAVLVAHGRKKTLDKTGE